MIQIWFPHLRAALRSAHLRYLLTVWTLVVGLFAGFVVYQAELDAENQLHQAAVGALRMDLAYRLWAARQGGVYVPISDHTPPNPYLAHLPHRDVTTLEGQQLTLVNPAYMTRQVTEFSETLYEIKGHSTSINPLRPENKPFPWETAPLARLEAGEREVAVRENDWYRLIFPLRVDAPCLKCHAAQGYKLGDLRGGLSVSLPTAKNSAALARRIRGILTALSGLWLIGMMTAVGFETRVRKEEVERIEMQRVLSLSRMAHTQSPNPIFWFNGDGRVVEVNAAAEALTGFSRDELLTQDMAFFHQVPPPRLWKILEEQGYIRHSGKMQRRDGADVEVEIAVHLVTIGAERMASAVLVDLTQVKAAQRETEDTRRFLQAVLDQAPDPMLVIGADYRILHANARFRAFSLRGEPFITHAPCYAVSHGLDVPCHGDEHPCPLRAAEQSRDPIQVVHKHLGLSGATEHLEIVSSPVFDDQGNLLYVVESIRDITPRLAAEAERRALELEAQKARQLESLAVLAGGVAHDFNNLLVGILGVADGLLEAKGEDDPDRADLDVLVRAARNAADLANQMLAYSGQGSFFRRRVDLHPVVREVVAWAKAAFPQYIEISLELKASESALLGDPTQLRQVIQNLLTNAREANARSIHLSTLTAGDTVLLTVRDDGDGMSQEVLERLFDPFFTTKFTGRGLGMSVVHGVVRGHGGEIHVQSEIGKGTRFYLQFPLTHVGDPPPVSAPAALPDTRGTVLLVDDEPLIRKVGERMLKQMGFSVCLAESGREAIQRVHETPDLQLILLDLTMPDMSGLAVMEELAPLPIPVLLISGYSREEVQTRLQGQRPTGFLQKPFRREELADAIAGALALGSGAAPAAADEP